MRRIMYSGRVCTSWRHQNLDSGLRHSGEIEISQDMLNCKLYRLESFGVRAKPIGIASLISPFGRISVYNERITAAVLAPTPRVYCFYPYTVNACQLDGLARPEH